ncbi:RND family efflux transporter MFP subunit (plasmid) [Sulfuricella denitrificans skB26]|uniref:RND family efflux transporter MFP subunit n=1 Tax=Sulfuricella denitrificans (strain DSM 22764 / NBRC 105220 / skB26) TaxID=1163617 RepID=S6ABM7_SULDS|nr:efflux RND transporter periplasmic adaptor subunit [Sulfuricella denitrificans]BAN36880.1 RND family efflux transporter MFP subunit [Sulfuricella denitrificans skB26]
MKSNHNFAKPLLAVSLVFLLALGACGKDEKKVEPAKDKAVEKAAPVRVEIVKKAPLVLTIALTGSVEAGRIAQLASPAEGPVLGVRVREGDLVKAGQVLLTLGRTEGATALVASSREDLKKEEDNLARTRRLVESGALAGEQLDSAAANAARMRALLVKAQETTRDYAVLAPWAGVVSKMKVRDGDFVAPRAPLAEIYEPKSLIVRLAVPEQEAARLALGMKAEVELDAYPGKRYAGSVSRLYPYLDIRTRTRTAEITVADVPNLLPGMFARAFLVRETLADTITVPAYSLAAIPGGGFAVFVAKDGKAVRRKVETGIEVDGRVRIVSGLDAGDKLIVAGQEKLKDGAAVKLPEAAAKNAGDAAKPKATQP